MYKLFLFGGMLLISNSAFSALTETKSCDTCGYNDAVEIAKKYFNPPRCQVTGLNGNNVEFGATTYQCETTTKAVIVANPLEFKSFKFIVKAEQNNIYSNAISITVSDARLTQAEDEAIDEFYEIDADFREAIRTSGTLTSALSSSVPSQFGSTDVSFAVTASSDSTCINHPSNYLTGEGAKRDIETEMADQISQRLGNQDWHDFTEDTDFTGGSIDISKSGFGASITLSHNSIGTFATRFYSNSNKLVFNVGYYGETSVNGSRNLNLAFTLVPQASLADGIPFSTFTSGGTVDMTNTTLSNCLIENLRDIPGATASRSSSGGGNTGTGGTGEPGFTIGGGGTCSETIKYTTCSTSGGTRTCTSSSITTSC